MKNTLKFTTILFLLLNYNIYAQQMVQNTRDVYRLKEYEAIFINKPLKDLLKEIKPEIKTVFVDENYFCFYFITREQLKKNEGSVDDSVVLFVDVKEYIDWQWGTRPKGKETIWSKEDADKYGNLIVTRIGVIDGKN